MEKRGRSTAPAREKFRAGSRQGPDFLREPAKPIRKSEIKQETEKTSFYVSVQRTVFSSAAARKVMDFSYIRLGFE